MQSIKFEPILKETIWGGNRILSMKNSLPLESFSSKDDILYGKHIGESWEISGVEGCETVVAEGEHKGKTLSRLIADLGVDLVGKKCYRQFGTMFPLLIKFIDAHDDLSIQVHPDDENARKQGLKFGKTEMWYIMESAPEASLLCGLKKKIDSAEYTRLVNTHGIVDALAHYNVCEGDVFFIPGGRIHSIKAGCLLAEIQQTSDVTYRIYDYDRCDMDGNRRELHTAQAARCIDYDVKDDYRVHYTPRHNERAELVSCKYFTTSLLEMKGRLTLDYSRHDCFVVLMCTQGIVELTDSEGTQTKLTAGHTILVPASTSRVTLCGEAKVLEITMI